MRLAIIGGTGLIGSLLIDRLGAAEVHALTRRPTGRGHLQFHEHVAPASDWPGIVAAIRPDVAVSALGTTMRLAGSEAAFRAVDFDAVVDFATAAKAAGARQMVTVSSVGADTKSAAFYLRTKGEMERALEALAFNRLDIFQPGLLVGDRGAERRFGERVGIALSPLTNLFLRGGWDRFAAIEGALVANAIAATLGHGAGGIYRHQNRDIRALAVRS